MIQRTLLIGIICAVLSAPLALADIVINVMAVNGAPVRKETPVKFDLPGDLKAEDILDTNGLDLDYNVNDANYYVHGKVALESKASKTFRVKVRDIWHMDPEQTAQLKAEINKGFEQIGKLRDPEKAAALKQQLYDKIDYIDQKQGAGADTIEKRMDAYRSYRKELQRIKNKAMAVDFWRSDPDKTGEKLIHIKLEAQNPPTAKEKKVKVKEFLPVEVKPEDVIEAEGFDVRFDQQKQQSFLFKEEEIAPGQKKTYNVGIRDIWSIPQQDIDYLRRRADYCIDFLKGSKFAQTAQEMYDYLGGLLKNIEVSQGQVLDLKGHISAFRANQQVMAEATTNVENLEKLLSVYREDLQKSKVENVLQKVRSLKSVANVAQQVFTKKPTPSNTWTFIGWGSLFVAFLTIINFLVWALRSKDKKVNAEHLPPAEEKKK